MEGLAFLRLTHSLPSDSPDWTSFLSLVLSMLMSVLFLTYPLIFLVKNDVTTHEVMVQEMIT